MQLPAIIFFKDGDAAVRTASLARRPRSRCQSAPSFMSWSAMRAAPFCCSAGSH